MKYTFFDFEVYPHWWCMVWQDFEEDFKDRSTGYWLNTLRDNKSALVKRMQFVTSSQEHAAETVRQHLDPTACIAVGYNIRNYDLPIAQAIINGNTPEDVRKINDEIIGGARLSFPASMFVYQDLIDDTAGSLKEKEGLLGIDIRDCPVVWDKKDLSEFDKSKIIRYCSYDVFSEFYYYVAVARGYVRTKYKIGQMFNLKDEDVFKSTNMTLLTKVLTAGVDVKPDGGDKSWGDIITPSLGDYIESAFKYEGEGQLYGKLLASASLSETVNVFGCEATYGDGGLHAMRNNYLYAESDSDFVIINFDAEAYYPSLMKARNLTPSNVNSEVFNNFVLECLRYKHTKKVDEEEKRALKILRNTVYGAMGNQYSKIYSPGLRLKVCRLGQMLITALASNLHSVEGVEVLQVNTDSVMCMIPREQYPFVERAFKRWSSLTGIDVSTEELSKVWLRDVNDSLLLYPNGGHKTHGAWLCEEFYNSDTQCLRAPVAPVCARMAVSWLLKGTPIKNVTRYSEELMDYVIPCKKGRADRLIQRMKDGATIDLGRYARAVAVKRKENGAVFTVTDGRATRIPNIPEHVAVIQNDMRNNAVPISFNDLDEKYYSDRIYILLAGDWHELVYGELYEKNLI